MVISFYKYQGTGNDFIIADNRQGLLSRYFSSLVPKLCDRRLGIGADGFIAFQNHVGYDFELAYYNADGSQSLCGNGSRCGVHFAQQLGIIQQKAYFLTTDGSHQAYIKEELIYLKMGDVYEIKTLWDGYVLNTGSPHYVKFLDNLEHWDVYQAGKAIRDSEPFQKEGTNVNFVQLEEDNTLFVRTYERGVEDETLSCGTGATAAALVAATKGYTSPITIKTRGGTLQVRFLRHKNGYFEDVFLIGPVKLVFQGTIDIGPILSSLS